MATQAANDNPLLGTVQTPGRDELERPGDEELISTLPRVSLTEGRSASPGEPMENGGKVSAHGQRFHIVRPHAEGGLGKVSVATDEELNREVALKEIKPQFAHHAESRARFMLEAEITGGLEHPGIVPVYGLGRYADGRPYYAMRFIQGDSLHDALTRFHSRQQDDGDTTVEFRRLLGRFIDVCQAIDYAHSRGVLHRDLKPGNVMLGKYGETLVVDWGLAKAAGKTERFDASEEVALSPTSGSAVEPTQMGTALGTPAFMSPEQASGRLDELGPTTDVYSLGATLYQVLTGQTAFAKQPLRELLAQVECGDFPGPRVMNPRVPPALEAVCLKAMSLRPAERYATAGELAEELERWLADEPVQAWREPLLVRLRRWQKRHQALVTGAVAAVLVGLVSLSVLALVIGDRNRQLAGKNIELDSLNHELDGKNAELVAAVRLAEKNEFTAKANEQFAREQSQFALQTLDTVVFELQRDLQNVAGTQAARRKVLVTALARLEQLSGQYLQQSAIDRTSLAALLDMADVILRIGTGADLGEKALALDVGPAPVSPERQTALGLAQRIYRRAHNMAQELAAAHSNDAQAQRDLAISYQHLGDVAMRLSHPHEAVGHYRELLEICEKLAAEPGNSQAQRDLAVSYSKLGDVAWRLGDTKDSQAYYQKSLLINERHATAERQNARAQRDLATSYDRLGTLALQVGKTHEARALYEKLFAICQEWASAAPDDAQAQRDLALAYGRQGDVSRRLGQSREALATYHEQFKICEKLAAAEPSDTQAQSDLARSHSKLGDIARQLDKSTVALAHLQTALDIRAQRAAADTSDVQSQRDLATSYRDLGDELQRLDKMGEALAHYKNSLVTSEKCAAAEPGDVDVQRDLAISQANVGDVELRLGNAAPALRLYRKSLAICEQRAATEPGDAPAHRYLLAAHFRLGLAAESEFQFSAARGHYQAGLSVAEAFSRRANRAAIAQEANLLGPRIEHCEACERALVDIDFALTRDGAAVPRLLDIRLRAMLAYAEHTPDDIPAAVREKWPAQERPAELFREALLTADKFRGIQSPTPENLYDASCYYALCLKGLAKLNLPDQDRLRGRVTSRALDELKAAVAAGYIDAEHMSQDADLEPLRALPEFKTLLASLTPK